MGFLNFFKRNGKNDEMETTNLRSKVVAVDSLEPDVYDISLNLEDDANLDNFPYDESCEEKEKLRRIFEFMGLSASEIEYRLSLSPEELTKYYQELDQIKLDEALNRNKHVIFNSCLDLEIKRRKSIGELCTISEVKDFARERMSAFRAGTFDYPEDVKEAIKVKLEFETMVGSGSPNVLGLVMIESLIGEADRFNAAKAKIEYEEMAELEEKSSSFKL